MFHIQLGFNRYKIGLLCTEIELQIELAIFPAHTRWTVLCCECFAIFNPSCALCCKR